MPCGTLSLEQLLYTADNHQQSDIDWYDVLCILTFLLSPEEWRRKMRLLIVIFRLLHF